MQIFSPHTMRVTCVRKQYAVHFICFSDPKAKARRLSVLNDTDAHVHNGVTHARQRTRLCTVYLMPSTQLIPFLHSSFILHWSAFLPCKKKKNCRTHKTLAHTHTQGDEHLLCMETCFILKHVITHCCLSEFQHALLL